LQGLNIQMRHTLFTGRIMSKILKALTAFAGQLTTDDGCYITKSFINRCLFNFRWLHACYDDMLMQRWFSVGWLIMMTILLSIHFIVARLDVLTASVCGLKRPTWHQFTKPFFFLLLYPYTSILSMLTFNKLGLNGGFVVKYALRKQ